MSVTLAANINASTKRLTLSAEIADLLPEHYLRIEDEIVQFLGYQTPRNPRLLDATKVVALRGMLGTTAVSHLAGAAVLGVAQSVVTGDDEDEPEPFSAGGVTVSDVDPGAIGAGSLWLQTDPNNSFNTLQLWVRNDSDDGWVQTSFGSSYDATVGDAGIWDAATGRQISGIAYTTSLVQLQSWADVTDPETRTGLVVGEAGSGVYGTKLFDFSGERLILIGTANPSAGGGVEAPVGSTFHRDDAGVGELWLKTGAGDTAWTVVTVVPSQTKYTGSSVFIDDAGTDLLTWNDIEVGADLFNRSNLKAPQFLAAGTYAISFYVYTSNLTAGGLYSLDVTVERLPSFAFTFLQTHVAVQPVIELSGSLIVQVEANDTLKLTVHNRDGAVSRGFSLGNALVVKLG